MKNSDYYLALMRARAKALYDSLTKGKSVDELMAMEDELEERTFMPRLEAEIGRNMPEARAMIEALGHADQTPTDLLWIKIYPGYEYGQVGRARVNRADIIDRLERIAFLELGDDIDAWQEWLAAFEADPAPKGYH